MKGAEGRGRRSHSRASAPSLGLGPLGSGGCSHIPGLRAALLSAGSVRYLKAFGGSSHVGKFCAQGGSCGCCLWASVPGAASESQRALGKDLCASRLACVSKQQRWASITPKAASVLFDAELVGLLVSGGILMSVHRGGRCTGIRASC